MLTRRTGAAYARAKKDALFIYEIYEADGDKPPGILDSTTEKAIFAAIYYGWYVGKYGPAAWDNP